MNTPEFILQALFFVVNSFALLFLVLIVRGAVGRMEDKLDATVSFMRWVKQRHDTLTSILYAGCKAYWKKRDAMRKPPK